MTRLQVALFMVSLTCLCPAVADDKPKPAVDDKIVAELTKAKEEYVAAMKSAGEKLADEFGKQQEGLVGKKFKDVAEKIRQVEQLQEERKAFEADPTKLPKSAVMQTAASDYRTRAAAAWGKCEKAFKKAAGDYDAKKDLVSAKAVLSELEAFKKESQDRRKRFEYDKGVFTEIKKGVWREKLDDGRTFTYQEVTRTKEYIELDATEGDKNLSLRLYDDRCDSRKKPNAIYSTLFTGGKWVR